MAKILESFIRQRKILLFITMMVMIIGVLSYIGAPKQQSPRIQLATALITTVYPGAGAEDVERLVTREIEEELMTLEAYEEVQSFSSPNHSVIFYTVKVSDDYTEEWTSLRRAMEDMQSELPDICSEISVDTDFMRTVGFILSIHSENADSIELEVYAENLEKDLEKLQGMNQVDVIGKREQEILIELNYKKMNQLSIGYNDIVQLIRSQNIEVPSGSLESGQDQVVFQVEGYYKDIESIENIVVAVSEETGLMTRLKNIGTVALKDEEEGTRILNGINPSILVTGYFEKGQNIIPIGDRINKVMDKHSDKLPEGMVIEKIMFQPDQVEKEIGKFMMSLLQGIMLVIIVVFIGLGIRNALVVALTIPLSILVTIAVMGIWSVEIQQISIAALIIALGMLVDNAIVVSDAIQVRIDLGEDKINACINGAIEVARPVLSSTLTTICTFMPILLLQGEVGEYLRSLPIIVILSLVASYLVAIFITPVLAYLFFKVSRLKKKQRVNMSGLLEYAMLYRMRVICLVLAIFAFSIYSVQWIGLKFFPYADTDMLYIDAHTERVVTIEETEALAKVISQVLDENIAVKEVVSSVGQGMPRFDTMFPAFPSLDYVQLLVIVDKSYLGENKDYKDLTELRDRLQEKLNQTVIARQLEVIQLEQGEPVGSPVNIKIVSDNMKYLKEAGDYVESILKKIPGTTNVDSDFSPLQITYNMTLDRYKASRMGLNNYDVQNTISIMLRGRDAGSIHLHDKDYNIKLVSDLEKLRELSHVQIKSPLLGRKVPLKNIGKLELADARSQIKKFNGQYIVNVNANVLGGYSAVEIQEVAVNSIDESLYPDLSFQYKGESDSINRNFGSVAITGLIFLAIIYGILLIQFKSFIRPLLILVTVPLSIIGSLFGLLITGISLSFTAFLGMISLAGIVVNNAIVLIDYIDQGVHKGKTVKQSCLLAVSKRTRPILLSTITTAVGLVPLIIANNAFFTPMAITLMSGLLVSTLLTLIVIPVLTSFFSFDNKMTFELKTLKEEVDADLS